MNLSIAALQKISLFHWWGVHAYSTCMAIGKAGEIYILKRIRRWIRSINRTKVHSGMFKTGLVGEPDGWVLWMQLLLAGTSMI